MKNLFAYGTLMCDDIMEEVSGAAPSGSSALLRGYRRLCVKGEHYPALIPDEGYMVEGIVYQGLLGPAWHRLDSFEGQMFSRQRVMLDLEEKNEQYPNQPDWIIVSTLLAAYAQYGIVPMPTPTTDIPLEIERVIAAAGFEPRQRRRPRHRMPSR